MKKYIVFARETRTAIGKLKIDFLKLKASFPGKEFLFSQRDLSISCDEFEIRYISRWMAGVIKKIDEVDGVYDSYLLEETHSDQSKFMPFENNEFLVWIREGDLILNDNTCKSEKQAK